MRRGRERRHPGLTPISIAIPLLPGEFRALPAGFRGRVLEGDAAREAASLVSGPFEARPAAYVVPSGEADLTLLVRWAADHGVPLVPRGGGTGMPGGNLGAPVVVALDEGFAGVGPWRADPPHVLRTGAAAVGIHMQDEARRRGRFLPLMPSSAPWCTAGGLAANNAAGARSFKHGAAASWIVALEGVDAQGRRFRVGLPGEGDKAPEELGLPGGLPALRFGAAASAGGSGAASARGSAAPSAPGVGAREPRPGPSGLPGWPRVRKNSSGYALDRYLPDEDPVQLLVGSEGTLTFITAVEWRTAPLPEARGVALLPARSSDDVVRLAQGARELGAEACEFLGRRFVEVARLDQDPLAGALARDAFALLFVEVDGTEAQVQAKLAAASELGREVAGPGLAGTSTKDMERIWSLRHAASPIIAREAGRGRISTQFIEDSVVPVDRLGDYLEGLDRILAEARFDAVVFGHAGDGNVHVNPLVDVDSGDWEDRVRWTLDQVAGLVAELGGTLAGEHGDGRLRAPYLERIWGPELTGAFRAVKEHFDPSGVLNPGVILPLPGQDPLEGFRPRPRAHPPLPEPVCARVVRTNSGGST